VSETFRFHHALLCHPFPSATLFLFALFRSTEESQEKVVVKSHADRWKRRDPKGVAKTGQLLDRERLGKTDEPTESKN
jgi:hypothetical protein